jgi:hypothetical protein
MGDIQLSDEFVFSGGKTVSHCLSRQDFDFLGILHCRTDFQAFSNPADEELELSFSYLSLNPNRYALLTDNRPNLSGCQATQSSSAREEMRVFSMISASMGQKKR